MGKEIEKICKNCQLYDRNKQVCRVIFLSHGQKINVPMEPDEPCFWLQELDVGEEVPFVPVTEIKQIRVWVEDPITGEPTNGDGIVRIETPIE